MPTSVTLTTTVSTKHLAPRGEPSDCSVPQIPSQPPETTLDIQPEIEDAPQPALDTTEPGQITDQSTEPDQAPTLQSVPDQGEPLRRSTRVRRPRIL